MEKLNSVDVRLASQKVLVIRYLGSWATRTSHHQHVMKASVGARQGTKVG